MFRIIEGMCPYQNRKNKIYISFVEDKSVDRFSLVSPEFFNCDKKTECGFGEACPLYMKEMIKCKVIVTR